MIDFKNKNTLALLATLATVTIITILAVVYYFMSSAFNVVMIDFNTKTLQDVNAWATENKLVEEQIVFEYEYDETIEKDVILSQDIKAEEKLKKDTVITFTVSKGFDPDLEVELVSFVGQEEEFIKLWFEENKFSDVTFELSADPKIKAGLFIEINIETPTAKRSEVIVIKMSVGVKSVGVPIVIPDFSDYTIKNIQAWATTNNMTLTLTRQFSDKIKKDGVIAQSIKAGEDSETGSKITVTVSNGEAVVIKDFKGMKEADIKKWATDNNVKVTFDREYHKTILTNVFIESKPKASTKVIEGSTIDVLISEGKIDVKDFTGKTYGEFEKWLTEVNKEHSSSAKLKVAYGSTNPKSSDVIATQSPNKSVISPEGTITVTFKEATKYDIKSQSNITVDEFKKYLSDNKMSVGSSSSKYSSIASGKLISSDAGSYLASTKINYVTSMGAYASDGSAYNNKTKNEINSTIKDLNNKGASINTTVNYNPQVSDTVAKDKTYGCSFSSSVVTCNISTGVKKIEVPNYAGQASPCGADKACSVSDLNIVIVEAYDDNVAAGKVIGNSKAGEFVTVGTEIKVTVSLGAKPVETATVPAFDFEIYDGETFGTIKSNISNVFTSFTDLYCVPLFGPDQNPDDMMGIKSISESEGAVIPINKRITFEIYTNDTSAKAGSCK